MSAWLNCRRKLQETLSHREFDEKIRPLQAQQVGDRWTLYAPNRYIQEAVQEQYLEHIESLLTHSENLKRPIGVKVGEPVGGLPKGPKRTDGAPKAAVRKPNGMQPSFTFDAFVPGKSSRLAYAAAQLVADKPGDGNNPLLIYGGVGIGKTHLMQAIGHELHNRCPNLKIVFCHGQVFVEQMVNAFRQNGAAVEKLTERYRSAGMLLFDDVQFLSKAPRTQREFLRIFNRLTDHKGQIVITCNCYPGQVEGLDDGLKSRFGGGLSVELRPPEKAVAVAILKREAKRHNVELTEEVANYIADLAGGDVRGLKGALQNVAQRALLSGEPITMNLAREALRHLRSRLVSINDILRVVAAHYGLRSSDILSNQRPQLMVRARHMAMSLARDLLHLSNSDIGKVMGGKHHSTVDSACAKMESLRSRNPDVDDEYCRLVRDLKG